MTDNKPMSLWLETSWSCFFHLHGTKERKSAACTSFTKFVLSSQTAPLFFSGVPVVSAFYWYIHRNDHECFQTNIRWYEDKLEHCFWGQSEADCLLSNVLSLFVWVWIHAFFPLVCFVFYLSSFGIWASASSWITGMPVFQKSWNRDSIMQLTHDTVTGFSKH